MVRSSSASDLYKRLGLEVVDGDGRVLWRNKRAEELAPWCPVGALWECAGDRRPCERDGGACPVALARAEGQSGRCRFAVPSEDLHTPERVYEMLAFPIEAEIPSSNPRSSPDEPRVMNLYVDRTQATIAERQLLLAERLASLGRVAQGVAHELNTPLATIRTLATDMGRALQSLAKEGMDEELARDLDESADLIRDETHRLGRITQALLAGGDLVRARIDGQVPLAAVVERARAIVFAGVRSGPEVRVDDSVSHLEVAAEAGLQRGEIDLAFTYELSPDLPSVTGTPVMVEELLLVTRPDQAPVDETVPFADVTAMELVLAHGRDPIRRLVERAALERGLSVKVDYEVQSLQATRQVVQEGLAASILPYGTVAEEIASGLLVARRIADPVLKRTLYLARPTGRAAFLNEDGIMKLMRSVVKQLAVDLEDLAERADD